MADQTVVDPPNSGSMTGQAPSTTNQAAQDASEPTSIAPYVRSAVLAALLLLLIYASAKTGQLGRLGWTALGILGVVAASAALFVGSNAIVSQAATNWPRYRMLVGGLLGAVGFGLLRGNRSVGSLVSNNEYLLKTDGDPFVVDDPALVKILQDVGDPDLIERATGIVGLVEWPVLGLILGAAAGWVSSAFPSRVVRVAATSAIAAVGGWLIGSKLLFANRPDISIVSVLIWAAIGALIGGYIGHVTHHREERALAGAAVGSIIGAWLVPELPGGSATAAILACLIPLVLIAVRFAWPADRTPGELAEFNRRARATIFLGPALLFLAANLVVPAISTMYLSLLDRDSEEFVGLQNYRDLFGEADFFDASEGGNFFSSQLFLVGAVLVIAGLLIGTFIHRQRNGVVGLERTGGSIGPILFGLFLLATAGFSVIRGTFANTLWWMLTVTVTSTVIGLVIAVLAERAGRFESTAKALVFMPMAISFVGASIIWRFQYQPRNISKNQTGVLNALWIQIGKLSHSGWPRILILLILAAFFLITLYRIRGRVAQGEGFAGYAAAAIVLGYLFVELARRSLGGFAYAPDGSLVADVVQFREGTRPFNNMYLMFIMIWIQSGFAMVILSAAIKAVPEDLLEAARIDGASDSEQFFNVILPQILPTVGVVVTATLVAVVKVFDIVKVSTGGNFGTNVLANDFFHEAFNIFDRGLGAAIAVIILLIVAPVLILNVFQMQKEGA